MAAIVYILLTISIFSAISTAETSTYIIHMDLTAKPLPFSDNRIWFTTILTSVITNRKKPKILYTYTDSIHGFSAILTNSELQNLQTKTGYVSFTKDFPVKLHTTLSPNYIGLNSNSGTWPVSNYGSGIVIGFIDTGIWPKSDSFHDDGIGSIPVKWKGDCEFNSSFVCNKKLIGARVFNKGLFANNPKLRSNNGQYSSPYDTIGHGTHVAAIAAGNFVKNASYFSYAPGIASGTAPHANIAVYKAVWEEGVYTSDVIAAIDQAIRDGVDVISLSLGLSVEDGENDPIAVAAFAAIQKGVFVVASGGNDGPYYWSLVNGAPWIMTVGAGKIGREFQGILTLGNGVRFSFPSLFPGDFLPVQFPVTYIESSNFTDQNNNLANQIVVCNEETDFKSKIQQVKSTGAVAAVLITDRLLTEQDTVKFEFPVAFISSKHKTAIKDYILSNKTTATAMIKFRKTVIGAKPGPEVDSYSSRGPFSTFPSILKPDILAPGTLILSAWPPIKPIAGTQSKPVYSNFNLLTGTSMATPHVAGVAALIKQVHPNWSPSAIKSAIMTTALTLNNPLAVGAGHVNTTRVLNPGLIYDTTPQNFINFLCHKHSTNLIKVITRSNLSIACKNPSPDLNYPSITAYFTSDQTGQMTFKRTLTNVGESKRSYTVKVRGLKGLNVVVEPKRLMFSERHKRLSFTVRLETVLQENVIVYGWLSWVDDIEPKLEVTCPVVATSLVQES